MPTTKVHGIRGRMRMLAAAAGAVTALTGAGLVFGAAPASAEPVDIGGLIDAFENPDGPTEVELAEDMGEIAMQLTLVDGKELTLDLSGHALTAGTIAVGAGSTLTVLDAAGGTGTLIADASSAFAGSAGIDTSEGALVLQSGTIFATGSEGGAAIGGGVGGSGGSFTMNGGNVMANADGGGAAIGGGAAGDSGTVIVNGGTLTATADGGGGAGIGGGAGGAGDEIVFGGGTTTPRAMHPEVSAIGPGLGLHEDGAAFGFIGFGAGATIVFPADGGDQLMPADRWVPISSTITMDAVCTVAGELELRETGLISGAGTLLRSGTGTVDNGGTITLPTANIQPSDRSFVSGRNFAFDYVDVDPVGSEHVYATTFAEGARTLPPGVWNTAEDGSGQTVDAETDLTGFGERTPLYQQSAGTLEVTASATRVDQGGSVDLTAHAWTAGGRDLGDVTADTVFTSSVPTDIVDGNRVAFPTASPHTITATYPGAAGTLTADVVIEVVAPPVRRPARPRRPAPPAATPSRRPAPTRRAASSRPSPSSRPAPSRSRSRGSVSAAPAPAERLENACGGRIPPPSRSKPHPGGRKRPREDWHAR
ncbi:hypothetical protein [Agromyces archimandritae]|uniref:Bacterial Ig-like domain-containing protein n=1 Tax=Agromyces archimandritae TaxID=2781962 RepID=A0A975FPS5_9MICO|nr:hypothetical protein [Agromyces archimandritae]QTX05787.1 hypothetical protein G127AT_06170 [Agromyces archimandritae]